MTKKRGSRKKSDRHVLKQISNVWVRDPDTGHMLFNPTDKRLLKNANQKTAQKMVPETGHKAAESSDTGSVQPVPESDSSAKD